MLSDAERMFWEQKAERLRTNYLTHMGNPVNYEKFCNVVFNRMVCDYKINKSVKGGKIHYTWQKQRTS
jgi:hypothetical protein